MLLAAIATLLAAAIQSATGLGFAMVAAPALFAVLEPREAVTTLLLLSLLVSALLLFAERRPLALWRRDLAVLLAAALPGLVLGVVVLDAVTKAQLQALTGVVVIVAAVIQLRVLRGAEDPGGHPSPGRPATTAAVGLITGGLTTSTSVNGPPLVLWLLARGAAPGEMRDTMAGAFLVLNVLGMAAVAATGEGGADLDGASVALLAPAVVAGWLVGRRGFERLRGAGFRLAVLTLVIVAGVASLLAGLF